MCFKSLDLPNCKLVTYVERTEKGYVPVVLLLGYTQGIRFTGTVPTTNRNAMDALDFIRDTEPGTPAFEREFRRFLEYQKIEFRE